MNLQILIGLLISFLPIFELRLGLPIVLDAVIKNNLPILPFFMLVLLFNILSIFFVFFFFDFLHETFQKNKFYERKINAYLEKIRKKIKKVEDKKSEVLKYTALMFLVAVPLPGTGAWTGSIISWVLDLKRMKSIVAISLGVLIAGLIVLSASLGLFSLFY